MNRYKLLNKVISTIALAGSAMAAIIVKTVLEQYQLHPIAVFIPAFLVLALLAGWLRVYLGQVVASMPWLRRLLLGRQFVEGSWLNMLRFPNGERMFGVIRIEPEGESLRYGGENCSPDGEHIGSFASHMFDLKFPVIYFMYDSNPSMNEYFSTGFVILTFDERGSHPPNRFTARCIDFKQDHAERTSIEAWKILDQEVLSQLASPERRSAAVRDQIAKWFTRTERDSPIAHAVPNEALNTDAPKSGAPVS